MKSILFRLSTGTIGTLFAIATLAVQAQPHYVEIGSLPTPAATERTELFDLQSRTWFSFPSFNNQSDLTTVFKATHAESGPFAWNETTSFPTRTTYWGRGATDGKHVYFTGTIDNVSKFASIGSDGGLGPWQAMTDLPTPAAGRGRALHQAFVYSGRLYVIGGWHDDGASGYADAYYAPIQENGVVGSFIQTTSLPVGVVGHSTTVASDGKVYVAASTNLFLGVIGADGTIPSWTKQANVTGMNHNNYGNVGTALLPKRLVIADSAVTFVCRLNDAGQVIALETTILNPATFNQRSVYAIDGKVFVAATTGKLYRIDGLDINAAWDDLTGGVGTWSLGPDWSLQNPLPGTPFLQADTQADRVAWKTNVTLATSWAVETTVELKNLYNDGNWTGTIGFALGGANLNLLILSDVIYSQDGYVYPGIGYWTGTWNDGLTNHAWMPGATNVMTLRLERPPGRNNVVFTITTPDAFRIDRVSRDIPDALWSQVRKVGLRAFKLNAAFSYLSVQSPLPPTSEIALYPGVTLRGEPGQSYAIQSSTPIAPATWTTMTNVTLTAPTFLWFDTVWANSDHRFYRVVQQQP